MKKYYYPDGTEGLRKPRDGEIFYLTDRVDGSVSEWVWDDYKEQWFKRRDSVDKYQPISYYVTSINGPKCECGSEKCGSSGHSTWCPKYTP